VPAIVIALVWRRPDVLVLTTPLAIVAAWSALTRPHTTPRAVERIGSRVLREGDALVCRIAVCGDGLDVVAAGVPDSPWFDRRPESGVVMVGAVDDGAEPTIDLRARRWGRHLTEPVRVQTASSWGAFRWETNTPPVLVTVLPVPGVFDARAVVRPASGLVGLHRSSRAGEGIEFAGIRPFVAGDRVRRVNWPRSLRAGSLHVNTTWADHDTHVVLLVDATVDVGADVGSGASAVGLDTTVRAAAAIAEHYARDGDRVSLRVLGGPWAPTVPPGTGQAHLRRILDALTSIRPGVGTSRGFERPSIALTGDALVIMLSPLVSRQALDRAVALGRRGVTVAVLDTLPERLPDDGSGDARAGLAWRIRLLERAREIRLVQRVGVPVIAWRGAGSLDQFLRDLARRAAAPRVRAR
jgi:uncharacterized protein (DUF58 family)